MINNVDDFIEAIHDAGWRPTADAQHENIEKMYEQMRTVNTDNLRQGMCRRFVYKNGDFNDVRFHRYMGLMAPRLCVIDYKGWEFIVPSEVATMIFTGHCCPELNEK
jgi:hypothetical protein